jgi:hypothetical protein
VKFKVKKEMKGEGILRGVTGRAIPPLPKGSKIR